MSLRTTLILMVVFIVLGTFAIFDPLRRSEKNEQKKDKESHVLWLKDKKLEGIKIAGKATTELICARKEGCAFDGTGDWNLNQPVEGKADSSAAGTLASAFLNLRHNEVLEFPAPGPEPKEFGLEQPKAEVTLKLVGEPPVSFKFGKAAAVGPNVYLSLSSEPRKIFLVPSWVPDMVNKDSFHWQNKRILPNVESTGFTRLGWKNKKMEVRAFKMENAWRLDRPVPSVASQVMLEGLASTIAYASAKSVFSPWRGTVEAKELLKGKPELELAFATADGSGHEVKLYAKPGGKPGAPKDFVAVVDKEPVMFIVDSVPFDRFQKPILEYRVRSVLDDNIRAQVDEVRLSFPREKQETYFKREGADWKYVSGAQPREPISTRRIDSFLDSLRDADFKAFLPAKGNSPEAKAVRAQTADLHVELKGGGKQLLAAAFTVHNRGVALTVAENEVRVLGDEFLRVLPVRLVDLYESTNKQVVIKDDKKTEGEHGDHPEQGSGHDKHGH